MQVNDLPASTMTFVASNSSGPRRLLGGSDAPVSVARTMAMAALLFAGAAVPVWAQQAAPGRTEFLKHCAPCHGDDGKGQSAREGRGAKPPDLTMLARRAGGTFSPEAVHEMIDGRRAIRAHHSAMPIWGCRYPAAQVPRWKKKRFRGYQQKPLETLLNLTCDAEETIHARIEAVVQYLAAIQQR